MSSLPRAQNWMTRFLRAINSACVTGLLIILALTAFGPRGVMWWLLVPLTGSATYVILTRPAKPAQVTPAEPPPPVRKARHPHAYSLTTRQKGKTCRICGMSDPERFKLKIGVTTWDGWPCHDTCVEWLERGPDPSVTEVHDFPPAFGGVTMAQFAENLDAFADQTRKALGIPPMQLGECECGKCDDGW